LKVMTGTIFVALTVAAGVGAIIYRQGNLLHR
jgi:hypothetical protein